MRIGIVIIGKDLLTRRVQHEIFLKKSLPGEVLLWVYIFKDVKFLVINKDRKYSEANLPDLESRLFAANL